LKDSGQIESLVEKCRQQDSRAQMEIYRLYYRAMFNVSLRIVNGFEDAEDVMQEAFIKAFKNIEQYKKESTFGAWLKRIVINESLGWVRKNKKNIFETLKETEKDEEENIPEENNCHPEHIKAEKVLQAMEKLKERYRIALSLYLIEGYDYEEMQEILGLSNGNIRTLVSRAKKKLKQILEQEYGIYK